MIVAVGSTNPVKINAVKSAFKSVFPDKKLKFIFAEVKSDVSKQPKSDKESIKGARNRAKKALKLFKANFGVGLEGGLQKVDDRWFDSGWAVVINKEGFEGIGSSLKMQTPEKMMKLIRKGKELGEVDDIFFKRKDSKKKEGHFGLMTKKLINRKDGYIDAVISALVRFNHPKLFEST